MGRFLLGSTVILLFPKNTVTWEPGFSAGSPTRMGERLGTFT
jgi:phosphatidylserine decarboxylase